MRPLICILVIFSLSAQAQRKTIAGKSAKPFEIKETRVIKGLSDSALLDVVQRQTVRYFWDFGHPVSGMARERSNAAYGYGNEVVTTAGTGFGVMALLVAAHRGWVPAIVLQHECLKRLNF